MRLARMDKLRQAAKTGVEMCFEKERDELGTLVQQAEANRMLLLKASCQQRVAKRERSSQLLMQKMIQDRKYKEFLHDAILKKCTAAEKKWLGLLEAEKRRVRARVLKVRQVAKSIYMQREFERMRKKDQLEDRLQRAKKQRAEYLRHRRSSHSSGHVISKMMNEQQGDYLSRKLVSKCSVLHLRALEVVWNIEENYCCLGKSFYDLRDL
ncbi:hypothetical protein I3843_08G003600 [Carya illinoinensis]|nr:hypothetical protein I3843_08G003600 [Carya illinoinensis]